MYQRSAIEGTISELTRAHGLRRSRYRGSAKVELQNLFIAAACNVKRWLLNLTNLLVRSNSQIVTATNLLYITQRLFPVTTAQIRPIFLASPQIQFSSNRWLQIPGSSAQSRFKT